MSANSRSLRVQTLCGWAAGLALVGVDAAWPQSPPPAIGRAQLPPPALLAPLAKSSSASTAVPPPPPVADLLPIRRPRHARPLPGAATVRAANAAARSYPSAEGYINATLFYDYEVGRLYQVQTSPHFLTAIMLRPGEKLLAKAAGDTVRWVLGETAEGTGADQQVVVLVKPIRGGLRTNIVLTTDQRTYLIEAASRDGGTYTSAVSWNYPQEQMQALAAAQAAQIQKAAVVVAPALAIDQLHFGYKIAPLKGKPPRWQPLRVFDDGTKTYIQFPINMAATDAPPLFLIGPHDTAELVNYRYINGYYVVDRLVDVAELRIGEKPQTIVRITRTGDRG
jgi:P-type conjugative transfer protein TrbG